MSFESIAAIIGDFAIAASFVAALGFGIAQVRAGAKDRRERLTLTTVQGMQTREMAAHFVRLRSIDMPTTMDEMALLPEEERISIIHYAQQMEMLGLMVYDGLIEVSLVERTLGDYVAYSWERYKSFAYDGRKLDPYMSEYFEWLAHRLEEYMRTNPRQPAYAELTTDAPA